MGSHELQQCPFCLVFKPSTLRHFHLWTCRTELFFKKSQFVFHRRKKVILGWHESEYIMREFSVFSGDDVHVHLRAHLRSLPFPVCSSSSYGLLCVSSSRHCLSVLDYTSWSCMFFSVWSQGMDLLQTEAPEWSCACGSSDLSRRTYYTLTTQTTLTSYSPSLERKYIKRDNIQGQGEHFIKNTVCLSFWVYLFFHYFSLLVHTHTCIY